MSTPPTIVCRPTRWFLFRAAVMLLMFSVFAVLFYIDGSTGYRRKNLQFFVHATFKDASTRFAEMNREGGLDAASWKLHAEQQSVRFPNGPNGSPDRSLLPAGLTLPMPWPEVLLDYERMKPLQWNKLWLDYSKTMQWDAEPPEHPFDAGKIREQWVVFWFCLALALTAAFFLFRTMRRSISADAEAVRAADGRRVPFGELKTLDLRKWDTKGLAFIDFEGPSGKGRLRIDGLTYGGFKPEDGEPAERLMEHVRARFSGEILEYAPAVATEPSEGPETPP